MSKEVYTFKVHECPRQYGYQIIDDRTGEEVVAEHGFDTEEGARDDAERTIIGLEDE